MKRVFAIFLIALLICHNAYAGFGGYLKADTAVKVKIGPFVDVGDGFTPQTDIGDPDGNNDLDGTDESYLIKHDAADNAAIQINSAGQDLTWDQVDNMDGWYNLSLTATETDTEGLLTIVIQDDSDCLPVCMHFMVMNDNSYEAFFENAAEILTVNVTQVGGTSQTANDNGADINAILTDTEAQDSTTEIRTLMTGADTPVCKDSTPLTAAEAEAEAVDALESFQLDHLLAVDTTVAADADLETYVVAGSVMAHVMGVAADVTPYKASTDSLDASMRTLAALEGEAVDALESFHLDHLLAVDTTVAADADLETYCVAGSIMAHVLGVGADVTTYKPSTDAAEVSNLANFEAEAYDAIELANLDHWMKVVTSNSATLPEVVDDTVLANILTKTDGDTSDYDFTSDSFEAIRDQGDAAWTTGGGTGLTALESGTAQAGAAGTITLAAAESATSNIFNGARIGIHTGTGAGQSRLITAYNGATKVATVHRNWVTNPANDSQYEILGGDTDVGWIEGGDATDAINAAADTAIETYDLDHLITAACDTGPAIVDHVVDNSILAFMIDDAGDISAYDDAKHSQVAIGDDADSILTDTGTTLDDFLDTEIAAIVAATITNAAGADVAADIIAVKTEVDKIGTIPALDGGAQTIGAAIAKLADDNGGADFDAGTDSLQEIRDRGDAAWLSSAAALITTNYHVPFVIDIAGTATIRFGMSVTDATDDLPSTAEITPGTIKIERKPINATVWVVIVNDEACLEVAGQIYYDEVINTASGYREEDTLRITFKSQKVVIGGNDFEITGTTGAIFHSYIRKALPDVIYRPW